MLSYFPVFQMETHIQWLIAWTKSTRHYVFCLFFPCGITLVSLELFILNCVPLEGAQIAVLLGIYKSSFLGFLAFMQLVVGLILTFLLTLPGLFVCLFVFPLSLYLELLQAERLAEWVSSSSWCYFNGIHQHSTNSLTALLLTSWPYMTYHTTNMTPALNNSFQVIKIDVVESGNPGSLQGKQTCSTLFTLSSTLSQN